MTCLDRARFSLGLARCVTRAAWTLVSSGPPRAGCCPPALPGWSARCADAAPMLAKHSGLGTHCVRCAHAVRTTATSMMTMRAVRAERCAALLATPTCAPAGSTWREASRSGGAPLGRREAQGGWPRAQRGSSTDSSRLSERSECNERSELHDAGRPTEHRRSGRTDRTVKRHRPGLANRRYSLFLATLSGTAMSYELITIRTKPTRSASSR